MRTHKEALLGKNINVAKLGPVSIEGARVAHSAEPVPTPRGRTRPKVRLLTRLGVSAAAAATAGLLLLGGEKAAKSTQIAETGTPPGSASSLLAETPTFGEKPLTISKVSQGAPVQLAEIGNTGTTTDTISEVAEDKIEAAGIQNPSVDNILKITTAIGSLTPEIENLDLVQPHQQITVPDRDSIRTILQADRGESQDAELNAKAAALGTAISEQGYNNSRDEAGALMARLAQLTANHDSGASVIQEQADPVAVPTLARPAEPTFIAPTPTASPSPSPTQSPSAEPTPEKPLMTTPEQESGTGLFDAYMTSLGIAALGVVGIGGYTGWRFARGRQTRNRLAREASVAEERRAQLLTQLPVVDIPWHRRDGKEMKDEIARIVREMKNNTADEDPTFYTRDPEEILLVLNALGTTKDDAQQMLDNAYAAQTPVVLQEAELVYRIQFDRNRANTPLVETTHILTPQIEMPQLGRADETIATETAQLAANNPAGQAMYTNWPEELIKILESLGVNSQEAQLRTKKADERADTGYLPPRGSTFVYRVQRTNGEYIPEKILARPIYV